MNLFLDCEFNEFQGELISMALVAENGRRAGLVAKEKNAGFLNTSSEKHGSKAVKGRNMLVD